MNNNNNKNIHKGIRGRNMPVEAHWFLFGFLIGLTIGIILGITVGLN